MADNALEFLQAAIYCGVPAATEAFRVAEAAIERFEAEQAAAAAT